MCASPRRSGSPSPACFQQGNQGGGLYLDVEEMERGRESRVLFAVGNPPQKDFLLQVMEVFNRLDLGVNRAYCLTISNGIHPYFLGTFYVTRRDGAAARARVASSSAGCSRNSPTPRSSPPTPTPTGIS